MSCARERQAAAFALGESTWLSLLRRCAGNGFLVVALARRAAIALAVAIGLAHHRGGAFLVLVHPHRKIAQHVLAQPLLPLDLIEGGRGRLDVEQSEMRFAIFAQTVGEGFYAPLFGLGDLASHLLDA